MKQCISRLGRLVLILLVMSATPVSATDHNPVIFLHGWNSSGSIWGNMISLLVNAGWSQEDLHPISYWVGDDLFYHGSISVEVYSKLVALRIKPIIQESSKVDFVVHSMGGLVLRKMIVDGDVPAGKVGRVVDLATPHYGQYRDKGRAAADMCYGSPFLWQLWQDWNSGGRVPNWLNVAGISATDGWIPFGKRAHHDHLVDQWSAGLLGTPVRYVDKSHADWQIGNTIYACGGDDDGTGGSFNSEDVVFRLVRSYLESGTVLAQSLCGVAAPTEEGGGIFFQVVDANGTPIPWEGQMVSKISEPSYPKTKIDFVQCYGESAQAQKQGIGLLAYDLGTYRGFDPGVYDIEFNASPVAGIQSFTARGIKVESNRATIIQIIPPTRLLVGICIDCSGSMGSNSRMENAISSAQRRIDSLPDGIFVEILQFNSGSTVVQPFVEIKTNADGTSNRDNIKEAIGRISSSGGTDILNAGYKMIEDILSNDPQHTAVRSLILLTDGEDEKFRNNKESFIQACNEAGVSFNSIAYGSSADAIVLDEVSQRTSGSHFGSGDSSLELDQAFDRTVNDILNNVSFLDWECLISGTSASRTFEVDANTPSLHAVAHVGEGYSVVLRHTQSGRICPATERSNGDGKTCTFDMDNPPSGTWQVVITRTASATADCMASVSVVAPASTETDSPSLTIEVHQGESALRATLKKGGRIKGAQLVATCRVGSEYREIAMSEESPGVYYLDLLNCGNFSGGLTVSAVATAGVATVVATDENNNLLVPVQEMPLSASFTRARHVNLSQSSDAAVRNIAVHPRWPWEGKVDVDFNVATIDNNTVLSLALSGVDEETGYQYVVESVSCDEPIETVGPGSHRLTWDAGNDVPNADFASFSIRFDVSTRPMLVAATNVTASAGTYFDGIHVTWNAVSNATGYRVYRSDSVDGTGRTLLATQNGRTFTDSTATADKKYYYYWIQPIVTGSNGLLKYEGPFAVSGGGWRCRLGGISGLSASSGTHYDGVHLSWTATSGATSYRIYRSTTSTASSKTLIGSSSSTSYVDTSTIQLQKYYYYWVEPIAVVSGTTYVGNMNSSPVSGWRNKLGTPTFHLADWRPGHKNRPEIDLYIDSPVTGATRYEYMSGDQSKWWNAMEAVGNGSSGYTISSTTYGSKATIGWAWAYRYQLRVYVRAANSEGVGDWVKYNMAEHLSDYKNTEFYKAYPPPK